MGSVISAINDDMDMVSSALDFFGRHPEFKVSSSEPYTSRAEKLVSLYRVGARLSKEEIVLLLDLNDQSIQKKTEESKKKQEMEQLCALIERHGIPDKYKHMVEANS